MTGDQYRALVVEDDADLAAEYAAWVDDEWTVETVRDAAAALAVVGDAVDVVVLGRRPGASGEEVLRRLRAGDYEGQVVLVTPADPDFEVVDAGFDDYLCEPVDEPTFRECLDGLAERATYDEELREYYALASKKAVLEATKTPAELAASDEYARLREREATQRERVDALLRDLSGDSFAAVFRDLFAAGSAGGPRRETANW